LDEAQSQQWAMMAGAELGVTIALGGDSSSIPVLPNVLKMPEDKQLAYLHFQRINEAMNLSYLDLVGLSSSDNTRTKIYDHLIYSGGDAKAISDLDRLSWPDLQKLQSPDAREKYIKDHHIDLLSLPARKRINDALDGRLAAKKQEDLK